MDIDAIPFRFIHFSAATRGHPFYFHKDYSRAVDKRREPELPVYAYVQSLTLLSMSVFHYRCHSWWWLYAPEDHNLRAQCAVARRGDMLIV